MDSTEQATASAAGGMRATVRPVWSLTVVHHPDPACVGRRIVLAPEVTQAEVTRADVTLGREHPTLGAEGDRKLSRVHARVGLDSLPGGATIPWVEDQQSRNGTFVDGTRITRAVVDEGAVISVGSLLLLVHRTPAVFAPPRSERVAGVGHRISALLEDVARAASRRDPVLFFGETGTGKGLLAEELHLASARGSFVTVHCGALTDATAHAAFLGSDGRPGLVDSAAGGTLFLDRLDDAPPALQAAIVAFLDGSALDVRVVASTSRDPRTLVSEGKLRDDLVARLSMWSLEVPPLRARREDVLPIATALLSGMDPLPVLHMDLALALVQHDWLGNVHALQGVLGRALLDAPEGELRLGPRVEALLARRQPDDDSATEPGAEAFAPSTAPPPNTTPTIARSGRFFSVEGHERVSLESRRTLSAILAALVRQHETDQALSLSVAELLAIAWPGERVLPRAGASRVYVSVTSLRRMGLRDVLERTPQGYRIDPRAGVRIVDG